MFWEVPRIYKRSPEDYSPGMNIWSNQGEPSSTCFSLLGMFAPVPSLRDFFPEPSSLQTSFPFPLLNSIGPYGFLWLPQADLFCVTHGDSIWHPMPFASPLS